MFPPVFFKMTRQETIESLRGQGYRLKYLPKGTKELNRKWGDGSTDEVIPDDCNYAVVQEDNKFVIDFDDTEFNNILEEYREKTLVVKTGRGMHYYFKDTSDRGVKIAKLYHNGKNIGDLKGSPQSYVIGPESTHLKGSMYEIVSNTNKVLELDANSIFKKLQDHGITTQPSVKDTAITTFEEGAAVGERNTECFKKACYLFDQEKSSYESGLNFILTWNEKFSEPLDTREVETTVKSAWDTVHEKEIGSEDHDKIEKAAAKIQQIHKFVTNKATDEILLWTGKIYDNLQAEALIKEETEKLIPNCTIHYRREVIGKIKAQTYRDLDEFDSDPNKRTILNGILRLDTLDLEPHTEKNLSRVLYPVEYTKPPYDDIEENLSDTLFWKSLTKSFTVDGKLRAADMQTVLEVMASTIVKNNIDQKAFIFLGRGDNGKSVFLTYLIELLGKNNVESIPLQKLSDDRFVTANLDGKIANIFTDLEEVKLKHTGIIKAIVCNEGISVQKKGVQSYTLHPYCKLIFSCNRFPKVYDQSQGFFRRWIIVNWDRNFENDPERVEHLEDKLLENQEEKNRVFSALALLAARLYKAGKFTHTTSWKITKEKWNANADPVGLFDTECIIDSEDHKTKRETHQLYKRWCSDRGETPLGIGQFGKEFSEYHDGDTWRDSSGRPQKVWFNIDFKTPKQTDMEEFHA